MARGGEYHGIVRAKAGLEYFSLNRFPARPDLVPWVEHAWTVAYNLPGGTVHSQKVLSSPNVHLAFEQTGSDRGVWLYGVPARPYVRTLEGSGRVLGLRFRPGGFHGFWGGDLRLLTGQRLDARAWLGDETAIDQVLDAADPAAMAEEAQAVLSRRLPPRLEPEVEHVDALVRMMADDPLIKRVEDLCAASGYTMRQLQRWFARFVGVSPGWVLKRFRLQEAAARLELDSVVDLCDLALDLGYFDQAHFTRDFKAVTGESPADYRRRSMIKVR
jgi:AraC-like DNA-binding protein